jgi:hypothetical protein
MNRAPLTVDDHLNTANFSVSNAQQNSLRQQPMTPPRQNGAP